MYAVRVKPQHPIGVRHRADIAFARDWTYLDEVPEAVTEDEWLQVRETTEEETLRMTSSEDDDPGGDPDPDAQFAKWVTQTSVKEIMAWAKQALELGNREGVEKIFSIEQGRGEDARKTLVRRLEEKLTGPSEDDEDPEDS